MAKKLIGGVAKIALGTVGTVLGLGGKKKAAAPTPGPQIMPLADDEAVKRARRRSVADQMQRGGRTSTMLSGESDTLGGS